MNTLESTNNLTKGYGRNLEGKLKLEEINRSLDSAQKLIENLQKEREKIVESLNEE